MEGGRPPALRIGGMVSAAAASAAEECDDDDDAEALALVSSRRRGLTLLSTLGGASGSGGVWLAALPDGRRVAVKELPRGEASSRYELMTLKALWDPGHPNIVAQIPGGSVPFETRRSTFLPLELCSGGDLARKIALEPRGLEEGVASPLFSQLLRAVEYCHSKRVSHGDIKAENVLLRTTPTATVAVLCDFGSASTGTEARRESCTPVYAAPEVLARMPGGLLSPYTPASPLATAAVHGELARLLRAGGSEAGNERANLAFPADMWACGVLLHVMLTGALPFPRGAVLSDAAFAAHVVGRWAPPVHVSADAGRLLRSLLEVQPSKRPTAALACVSPWVQRPPPREGPVWHPGLTTRGGARLAVCGDESVLADAKHALATVCDAFGGHDGAAAPTVTWHSSTHTTPTSPLSPSGGRFKATATVMLPTPSEEGDDAMGVGGGVDAAAALGGTPGPRAEALRNLQEAFEAEFLTQRRMRLTESGMHSWGDVADALPLQEAGAGVGAAAAAASEPPDDSDDDSTSPPSSTRRGGAVVTPNEQELRDDAARNAKRTALVRRLARVRRELAHDFPGVVVVVLGKPGGAGGLQLCAQGPVTADVDAACEVIERLVQQWGEEDAALAATAAASGASEGGASPPHVSVPRGDGSGEEVWTTPR